VGDWSWPFFVFSLGLQVRAVSWPFAPFPQKSGDRYLWPGQRIDGRAPFLSLPSLFPTPQPPKECLTGSFVVFSVDDLDSFFGMVTLSGFANPRPFGGPPWTGGLPLPRLPPFPLATARGLPGFDPLPSFFIRRRHCLRPGVRPLVVSSPRRTIFLTVRFSSQVFPVHFYVFFPGPSGRRRLRSAPPGGIPSVLTLPQPPPLPSEEGEVSSVRFAEKAALSTTAPLRALGRTPPRLPF